METRKFDLETVLSVTTGCLLTNWNNLVEIVGYLLDKNNISQFDLIKNQEICANAIFEKYPDLALVEVPDYVEGWDKVKNFVNEQIKIYGNSFELSPLSNEYKEQYNKSSNIKL